MVEHYAEHHASVTVNAQPHQVYMLFSHFNDFPKFMSFVKEVTYYDDQRSHWVAEVAGRHEWDAINEAWIPDQQIGWHSTAGLKNTGKVTFEPSGANHTRVDVTVMYQPPAGVLGTIGEKLGAGNRFEHVLQTDLNNFARMIDEAPAGALDPAASNYLFHSGSAAARKTTTTRQNETMYHDPALSNREEIRHPTLDRDITGQTDEALMRDISDVDAVPPLNYPDTRTSSGPPSGSAGP